MTGMTWADWAFFIFQLIGLTVGYFVISYALLWFGWEGVVRLRESHQAKRASDTGRLE